MHSRLPLQSSFLSRRAMLSLMVPAALGLQACTLPGMSANAATSAAASLWNTEWRLLSLGDQPAIADSTATLDFYDEGQAGGNASCNRFFGTLKVAGNKMEFGPIGSTKKACSRAAMQQESAYLAALSKAQRFELLGDSLVIHVEGMDQPLSFASTK